MYERSVADFMREKVRAARRRLDHVTIYSVLENSVWVVDRTASLQPSGIGGRQQNCGSSCGATIIIGRKLSEREKMLGAALVHYATAAAAGALYGTTAAQKISKKIKWSGALFGIAMWILGNELLMPSLRLTNRPSHDSLRAQANALGEHLVFGLTTDSIYHEMRRRL